MNCTNATDSWALPEYENTTLKFHYLEWPLDEDYYYGISGGQAE